MEGGGDLVADFFRGGADERGTRLVERVLFREVRRFFERIPLGKRRRYSAFG